MFRVLRFTVAATLVIACIQLTVWVIGCNDWNATGFFKKASNLQVRTCLITGADVSVTDDNGRTPLHNSVMSWSYPPTDHFSALIAAGAEIKAMDADGLVPLQLALFSPFITPEIIAALAFPGVDINARDERGLTPLQFQASVAGPKVITALLAAGADVDVKVEDHFYHKPGETLLHVAATNPNSGGGKIIELLLTAGMDVDARDDQGQTPLHTAASTNWGMDGSGGVILALLTAGADVSARDQNGELPIDKADRFFNHNISRWSRRDERSIIAYELLGVAKLE